MRGNISEMLAAYFAALSHPTRIEILGLLKNGRELCTCDIMKKLKKCQSNISRHLEPLKRAGIVVARNEATRTYYRIKDGDVFKIADTAMGILYRHMKENHKMLKRLTTKGRKSIRNFLLGNSLK
ncbi:MAG: winged helix-turn-helix transcriptional regulator [Elusimicrobia bacterium]|nr:winged helix-turn-helix transcriptional regulator [Elusimicrobiota bacterium]